ncbi:UNVERIFIED_CONTAM: hypothetical protein FKN15_032155 [Acipenser sinensis]
MAQVNAQSSIAPLKETLSDTDPESSSLVVCLLTSSAKEIQWRWSYVQMTHLTHV